MTKLTQSGGSEGLGAVTVTVLLVPDGDRVWVGTSNDQKQLVSRLQAALNPGTETLGAEVGLLPFKTERANAAGFGRLEGALGSARNLSVAMGIDTAQVLLAMPHRGRTPIRFSSVAAAQGPGFSVRYQLPKAAIEDLAAAVVSVVAQGGGAGL
jgi:hypothetical protein